MTINWTTTLQPKVIRRRQVHLQVFPSQRRFLHCSALKKGFSGPVASGKTMALCYQGVLSAARNPNCVDDSPRELRDVILKIGQSEGRSESFISMQGNHHED